MPQPEKSVKRRGMCVIFDTVSPLNPVIANAMTGFFMVFGQAEW